MRNGLGVAVVMALLAFGGCGTPEQATPDRAVFEWSGGRAEFAPARAPLPLCQ